jgi:hypothetical protein
LTIVTIDKKITVILKKQSNNGRVLADWRWRKNKRLTIVSINYE